MTKEELSREKQKLCKECLLCCKLLVVYIQNPERLTEERAFWKARGWVLQDTSDNGFRIVTDQFPCPQLTPFGCKIYAARPIICQRYSGLADPIIRGKCKWNKLVLNILKSEQGETNDVSS